MTGVMANGRDRDDYRHEEIYDDNRICIAHIH